MDFNDSERPRTPKTSSKYLKEIFTNNGFIENTHHGDNFQNDKDVQVNLVIS